MSSDSDIKSVKKVYKYGFKDPEKYLVKLKKGLNEGVVREISRLKDEPAWMLKKRLEAYSIFKKKKMPNWGADISGIDFQNIHYYLKPTDKQQNDWKDVPENIKNRLVEAVKKAFDSEEFTAFMDKRGFKKTWKGPVDARAFHKQQDESICEVMKAVGMAK